VEADWPRESAKGTKKVLPFQGESSCVYVAGFPGRLPWADEWQPFGLKKPPLRQQDQNAPGVAPLQPIPATTAEASRTATGFTPLPFYPADDLHDLIYRFRGVALSGQIIVCMAEFPGRLPWAVEWQPFGLRKSGGCRRTRRARRGPINISRRTSCLGSSLAVGPCCRVVPRRSLETVSGRGMFQGETLGRLSCQKHPRAARKIANRKSKI
jgi:hypothetical protein